MTTYTDNLELVKMSAGAENGTWGDPVLNQQLIDRLDATLGGVTTVALTSSNVTLTQTQWRNATIKLTGTLGANVSVSFPLNVNSATVAVGGPRVIDNQCTGNFTVTIKTIAVGSTGVVVPQGLRSLVVSDTANVTFSDDRLGTTDIGRLATVAGTPNGTTTGVAGTAYKPTSLVADRTNKIIYMATADGTSGWVPQSGYFPPPQGYLTLTSGTAIITGDVTAATAVYYTPYQGNMIAIYDGAWLQAYFFTEQTLTLSSSQAASGIYDVFAFLDSGTLRIGTGPAWSTATAGAGARGTGAGTTQLSRINGLWTNTVSITARNGASTYSVSANQATYLGSLAMDGTNGQVSCYRSYGQSRKWGVWNAYNRVPLYLKAGDPTASWTYNTNTIRASNGSSSNRVTIFQGLAEEAVALSFAQNVRATTGTADQPAIGLGVNSTTASTGLFAAAWGGGSGGQKMLSRAEYTMLQASWLGINDITSLENGATAGGTFFGTEANMVLQALWRG